MVQVRMVVLIPGRDILVLEPEMSEERLQRLELRIEALSRRQERMLKQMEEVVWTLQTRGGSSSIVWKDSKMESHGDESEDQIIQELGQMGGPKLDASGKPTSWLWRDLIPGMGQSEKSNDGLMIGVDIAAAEKEEKGKKKWQMEFWFRPEPKKKPSSNGT